LSAAKVFVSTGKEGGRTERRSRQDFAGPFHLSLDSLSRLSPILFLLEERVFDFLGCTLRSRQVTPRVPSSVRRDDGGAYKPKSISRSRTLSRPGLVSNWMDARLVRASSMVARTSEGGPAPRSSRYTSARRVPTLRHSLFQLFFRYKFYIVRNNFRVTLLTSKRFYM
jgi:hypothetical protein